MDWLRIRALVLAAGVLGALALGACSPVGTTVPQIDEPAGDTTGETHLLNNLHMGYSLEYPVGFDVVIYEENGVALVVQSLLNPDDARLNISVDPANGLSADEAADAFAAGYPDIELARSTDSLGGEAAVMFDRVPGQEFDRVVLVIHDDRLFTLRFTPADPALGEAFADMQELYHLVTSTFTFDPMP